MSAQDDWHRQCLSPLAESRLMEFQAIRKSKTQTEAQFEFAFQRFVSALSPDQVRTLANVLSELSNGRAMR